MEKLISEERLPKDKRGSAKAGELLSCLEELEDVVRGLFDDYSFDTYTTLKEAVLIMNKSIRDKPPMIDSEDKDFDRFQKYMDNQEKFNKGMDGLEERARLKGVFVKKENKAATDRGVKN